MPLLSWASSCLPSTSLQEEAWETAHTVTPPLSQEASPYFTRQPPPPWPAQLRLILCPHRPQGLTSWSGLEVLCPSAQTEALHTPGLPGCQAETLCPPGSLPSQAASTSRGGDSALQASVPDAAPTPSGCWLPPHPDTQRPPGSPRPPCPCCAEPPGHKRWSLCFPQLQTEP